MGKYDVVLGGAAVRWTLNHRLCSMPSRNRAALVHAVNECSAVNGDPRSGSGAAGPAGPCSAALRAG